MGILMPMTVPLVYEVLGGIGSTDAGNPILLGTIGGVLAGSIFGDHCSPISDTTVLSSQASGCDHIAHVWTQMPYALTVGGVAILCGTLPLGLGVPVWLLLPVGVIVMIGVLLVFGKRE
jgi:Na+/H+ antiporter NhaC